MDIYIEFSTITRVGNEEKVNTYAKTTELGYDIAVYNNTLIPNDVDYVTFYGQESDPSAQFGVSEKKPMSCRYYFGTMFTLEDAKAQLERCQQKLDDLRDEFEEETSEPLKELDNLITKFLSPEESNSAKIVNYREIVSKMTSFVKEETVLDAFDEREKSVEDCKDAIATLEEKGYTRAVKTRTGNWEAVSDEDKICGFDQYGRVQILG